MAEQLPRPWGIASMEGRSMRQPTGGTVKGGEKVENIKGGKDYARELDYFNVDDAPAIKAIYGDKPKLIRGIFGSNDVHSVIDLGYKKWHQNNTIACRGDGRIAVDLDEGVEIECLGEDCPKVQGEKNADGKIIKSCKRGIYIAFIPLEAPTIAVHTFTSSGWRTIENTLAFIDLLQSLFGRIAGIPWVMLREPYKCTRTMDDGKKVNQVHHTIRFDLEKPIQEITPIFVPGYERPAALDQADPSFYPKSMREAAALPPAVDAPEIIPAEAPLAAVPNDPELVEVYKGFDICGITEESEQQRMLMAYEGRLPDLNRFLSDLLDSQLVKTPAPSQPARAPRYDQEPRIESHMPAPAPEIPRRPMF